MAVSPGGRRHLRVAVGALLIILPGRPADARSLECAGNDYIFGRNVVSRTLTLRMDEKTLVQELDGRPCDRGAAEPAAAACFAEYTIAGTLTLARVSYDRAAGRAVLYAYPKAAAPATGRPTVPAIAMFKGLCHET
jgi:hypothetical protein